MDCTIENLLHFGSQSTKFNSHKFSSIYEVVGTQLRTFAANNYDTVQSY